MSGAALTRVLYKKGLASSTDRNPIDIIIPRFTGDSEAKKGQTCPP